MTPKRIAPKPGQESVWDYPRPPRLEATTQHIQIIFNGITIADTHRAWRVLETSHPPVYYLPPDDLQTQYLSATAQATFCEWKGQAAYYTVRVGDREAAGAGRLPALAEATAAEPRDEPVARDRLGPRRDRERHVQSPPCQR